MISFLSFHKGEITKKSLFVDEFLALDHFNWFGLGEDLGGMSSFDKFDRNPSLFYEGIYSCFGIETTNPSPSRSNLLRKGTLRTEF
jgi:hypothetical protein